MNQGMALEWLKTAEYDLLTVKEIIDNEYLTHVSAFHSQQCIEKSFKGLIEFRDGVIPKIHSLLKLADFLGEVIDESEKDMLDLLDKLYIDSRYPGELGILPDGKPDHDRALEFYKLAEKYLENAKKRVTKGY